MISSLRRALSARWARTTVWVVITVIMALSFVPIMYNNVSTRDVWFFKIGKHTFDAKDLQREQEELVGLTIFRYGQFAQYILAGLNESTFLQHILRSTLLSDFAVRSGIVLNDAFLNEQLKRELERRGKEYLNQDGSINKEHFEQAILPLTPATFMVAYRKDLEQQMVTQLTNIAAYATDYELRQRYEYLHSKRTVNAASVPASRFVEQAKKTAATDEQLKQFYVQQNNATKRYWKPQQRAGVVYEFDPANYGINVSDADVEKYYNLHKHSEFIAEPARIKVRHIFFAAITPQEKFAARNQAIAALDEIKKNPAAFEEMALKYSQDPNVKKDKGLTDFFKRNEKEAAFADAAFALAKDGDISSWIETAKGYEIIQRVERKAATYKDLASVKADIVKKLSQQKFAALFEQEMRGMQLRPDKLKLLDEMAAKKKAKTTDLSLTAINEKPEIQRLFKATKGSFSFYVDNNKGYALKVTELIPEQNPPFEAVKAKVSEDWYTIQGRRLLHEFLQKALKELAHTSFEEVAKKEGMTMVQVPAYVGSDKKELEELAKKFSQTFVSHLQALHGKGQAVALEDNAVGYMLQLKEVSPLDPEQYQAAKPGLIKDALMEQDRLLGESLIASLGKTAKIEFNESLKNQHPTSTAS